MYFLVSMMSKVKYDVINLIIILGKYHIYKAKFSHSKPCFLAFQRETEQYIHKKAVKTYNVCSLFTVFI